MSDPSSDCDPFEQVAQSFLARYRAGERPPLDEYIARYPELAELIRELFPSLIEMEELRPAPAQPAPARPEEPLPSRLGEYRILREVGRGGMGVVYEAVQESLGRHVALKVLPPHALLEATHLERFRREAQAAARLHHTNIVPVFGVGQHGGVHYYAMQFIQGQGLDEVTREVKRLREGGLASPDDRGRVAQSLVSGALTGPEITAPLPARDSPPTLPQKTGSGLTGPVKVEYFRGVARVGLQAAEALTYAHRHGVVHRDIKPGNLLLDLAGTVWVTDFGLARVEGSNELTTAGDVVGTLRYLAPERFQGVTDARCDVYSLGLTLYEMATLRPAFEDTDRGRLLRRILHEEPLRPRQVDPGIPRDLETVILKAMAKDPAQRLQTADELAGELRRFLADEPLRIRRVGLWERFRRWRRHNPMVANLTLVIAALLLALFFGGAGAFWAVWERGNEARDRLRDSQVDQARARIVSVEPGRRVESLRVLAEAAARRPSVEQRLQMRNLAVAAMTLADVRPGREWECYPGGSNGLAFDSANERCARSDTQGRVTVFTVADGKDPMSLEGLAASRVLLDFSPDGRFLAAGTLGEQPSRFQIWDLQRGRKIHGVPETLREPIWDFSPNGSRMAVIHGADLCIYNLAGGREVQRLRPPKAPHRLRFHPGGRRLAVLSAEPLGLNVMAGSAEGCGIAVLDLDTGKVNQLPGLAAIVSDFAWSADGNRLATLCTDFRVRIVNADSGSELAVLEGHQAMPLQAAFSRRGDLLVTAANDGTVRLWDSWHGRQLVSVPVVLNSPIGRLGFGPGDGVLGAVPLGARVRLYELEPARECRTLYSEENLILPWNLMQGFEGNRPVRGLDFSDDGRLLASAPQSGVRLWDVATGREVSEPLLPPKRIFPSNHPLPTALPITPAIRPGMGSVCFAPDGRGLFTGSTGGLERWPLTRPDGAGGRLLVGPRQKLDTTKGLQLWGKRIALSADGRFLAGLGPEPRQVLVVSTADPAEKFLLVHSAAVSGVALSHDGRWAATSTIGGAGTRIWEVRTGSCVAELGDGEALAAFSPDGRHLVTGSRTAYRCWGTDTWQPRWELLREPATGPGHLAFTRDGSVLAVAVSGRTVRLFDVTRPDAVPAELATLASPNADVITWLCFSPDGGRLAVATEQGSIQLWDLRRIRERLAAMRLDWERPSLPAPDPAEEAGPLQVEVVQPKVLQKP